MNLSKYFRNFPGHILAVTVMFSTSAATAKTQWIYTITLKKFGENKTIDTSTFGGHKLLNDYMQKHGIVDEIASKIPENISQKLERDLDLLETRLSAYENNGIKYFDTRIMINITELQPSQPVVGAPCLLLAIKYYDNDRAAYSQARPSICMPLISDDATPQVSAAQFEAELKAAMDLNLKQYEDSEAFRKNLKLNNPPLYDAR